MNFVFLNEAQCDAPKKSKLWQGTQNFSLNLVSVNQNTMNFKKLKECFVQWWTKAFRRKDQAKTDVKSLWCVSFNLDSALTMCYYVLDFFFQTKSFWVILSLPADTNFGGRKPPVGGLGQEWWKNLFWCTKIWVRHVIINWSPYFQTISIHLMLKYIIYFG